MQRAAGPRRFSGAALDENALERSFPGVDRAGHAAPVPIRFSEMLSPRPRMKGSKIGCDYESDKDDGVWSMKRIRLANRCGLFYEAAESPPIASKASGSTLGHPNPRRATKPISH